MIYMMAKGWNECTTNKKEKIKTGRAPRIPKLPESGPGRSRKEGIDWYRYQIDVIPYLLDDFEQFQKQVGSEALLI